MLPAPLRLRLQRLSALWDAARRAWPGQGVPAVAHLRVRTSGRTRDVLLGTRTASHADLVVVDWRTAPLSEALLGYEEGEDYEILLPDRTLEGTVLEQHLLSVEHGELAEVLTPNERLWRDGAIWRVQPRAEEGELHPRGAAARRWAEGAVVLDEHQRAAVQQPADTTMLVLGEAGFGKTTVALHRLAWLAERRAPSSPTDGGKAWALVIVPTEGLRRLCARLLTRLSVPGVDVLTFASFIIRQARAVFDDLPARLSRDASVLTVRLKRHAAVAQVIPTVAEGTEAMRAVLRGRRPKHATWQHLLHLWGDRELLRQIAAIAGEEVLPPRVIDEVIGHTRVQFTPTTEQAMRHVDAQRLRTVDGWSIDEGTPEQDARTVDLEDLPVMFAINHAMTGTDATRAGSLRTWEHVVVDEAQELAPLELAVLGRAVAPGGGLTVVGDERQQVDESACFGGWDRTMAWLSRAEHARVELRESYRSPPAIEALAKSLFDPSASLEAVRDPASSLALAFLRCSSTLHLATVIGRSLRELRDRDPSASVAVVLRHPEAARSLHGALARAASIRLVLDGEFTLGPGACVTTVAQIKGLEFTHVVVPDATSRSYPDDARARRALYVAITRAMHQAWLCADGPWSPLLAEARATAHTRAAAGS
ncbi:ATP-binding domain-containing protein [Paraliomyxa miuraensis]|uniref:ATP-binding domain-containing protein n=1 Tax=Paraliomyxa miuraensis TaxID=376150 RepID=UPI00224DFCE9|nr:ATP-binding domain-containing protein [Paraliomyxa miuraensis]MCX4242384.1 ATP-binding domain-containing protein [Paraliomyxa miuraensis]